ncbi:hypothetical protein POPTR_014G057550v4 [Populus trichocarpa]|uniref:Uncharacterized protein n=1 Tax=Populus trichocarpa TaxID=3694 RepID=A0ACC0RZD2_POPTR|nr:hypothetical protein POPTR_014G057550v4 [Populus trichocarpa]
MDEGMQQFQQSLVELEKCCPTCLISSQSERNGNREALTALRKRAKTTKTSIKSPFESIMKTFSLLNFSSSKRQWQFLESRVYCDADQEQLEYEAKNLQSFVREKSLLISEKGVLADSISQRLLRSSVTLTDKPK